MTRLEKAAKWLQQNGRPLDLALIENGANDKHVLAELAVFSNTDGGFGNALEPDVRLPGSSVIATTLALQILSRCAAKSSDSLVRGAMAFLDSTFDQTTNSWPIVPVNVGDAPHAPWWEYRQPIECLVNPRVEIVGYMFQWPDLADHNLREELTGQLMKTLSTTTLLEMHDLLVFGRLFGTDEFPRDIFDAQVGRFYELAASSISTSPSEWAEYGLTPLTIIDHPTHALAAEFSDALKLNLQYLVETQEEDGSWTPSWSWYGAFPDEWPTAERDIRSLVTRETVNVLSRFGVIG